MKVQHKLQEGEIKEERYDGRRWSQRGRRKERAVKISVFERKEGRSVTSKVNGVMGRREEVEVEEQNKKVR